MVIMELPWFHGFPSSAAYEVQEAVKVNETPTRGLRFWPRFGFGPKENQKDRTLEKKDVPTTKALFCGRLITDHFRFN